MPGERYFLDTVFIVGLLNRKDQHHSRAKELFPQLRYAAEIWTTEAVLAEVGNLLARLGRQAAAEYIEKCYRLPSFRIISVSSELFLKGTRFYASRADKEWGLTDCVSFIVMEEQGLSLALTDDQHFEQAGFTAIMKN